MGRSVAGGDSGQKFHFGFGQVEFEGQGLGGGAHFLDGLTENVGGLIVALLAAEGGEPGFQEHQA